MKKIYVTKSYLPPMDEYIDKISTIWDNHVLTNYGPLNCEFVDKLENYLNVKNLHYVTNGTISIQLAIDALNITEGEVITTPFTFISTITSIIWQRCTPVFVDIEPTHFNIDPNKIEEKITDKTKAILAVHCFGYPCDVEKIQEIALKHNIPVIYDAAHSFGTKLNGKSVLSYGDISSCSLHATKVFHSIEGGLCVVNNPKYNEKMSSIKNFGHFEDTYKYIGINAKNSEFHAAMGLCILDHIAEIIDKRKQISELYKNYLAGKIYIPEIPENLEYNYIYFPVVFNNEEQLLKVFKELNNEDIYPRRYFYPSLDELDIIKTNEICKISSEISKKIACLPLDTYLEESDVERICKIIINNL